MNQTWLLSSLSSGFSWGEVGTFCEDSRQRERGPWPREDLNEERRGSSLVVRRNKVSRDVEVGTAQLVGQKQ